MVNVLFDLQHLLNSQIHFWHLRVYICTDAMPFQRPALKYNRKPGQRQLGQDFLVPVL